MDASRICNHAAEMILSLERIALVKGSRVSETVWGSSMTFRFLLALGVFAVRTLLNPFLLLLFVRLW